MLWDVLRDRQFEAFSIDNLVDQRRHYRLILDPRFPFAIKLYSYPASAFSNLTRYNWHERLEINVPLTGSGRFRMGGRILDFSGGDIIVVDNLKLHGSVDYRGQVRQAAVITFMPDLICSPRSYPCDSVYLRPFFCRASDLDPVLRTHHPLWKQVDAALAKVAECYGAGQQPIHQAGCKTYLLEALYGLTQHFGLAESEGGELTVRMHQSLQFGRLHEHLWENCSQPITVSAAASIVGMTKYRFMKFFKKATGTTFVNYLTHLRLSNARRLLIETDRSIADIATSAGFADQCYFDRRFKRHYGNTPQDARREARLSNIDGESF
jgi:AraC-like DNA-binding protein